MLRSKGIRIAVIGIITIFSTYFIISSINAPTSSHKTEYNSSKLQFTRELDQHRDYKQTGINFQPNKKFQPDSDENSLLHHQLSTAYPYDKASPFPKLIWQTWKVGITDESFPARYLDFQESWNKKNRDHQHHVIPDEQCDIMIEELYKSVPDVARAYRIMPKSILKADFFRYLILFARGGVYTDIDTVGLKSIDKWVSGSDVILGKPNYAGLVVGIEADPDRPDWAEWYARRIQFCQWTIQSKRGHPMLRELIAKITDITLTRDKRGELERVLGKDEGGDIMNWTGPGIFTDTVFEYMNSILHVDWKVFTGMEQPIVIDDVLVLPITSFSPDVNQMGAKSSDDEIAYVKHMFSGSWKDDGMPEME
ncbi:OCH1 Initiation-specific alpha-1 [Candida maltosa Xu316]